MIRLLLSSLLGDIRRYFAARREREARQRYELSPAVCRVSCQTTGRLGRAYTGSAER